MGKDHSKRSHAKFAPSAAHIWKNCYGAVKAWETAPPKKESPYMLKGTYAHEILQFIVERIKNKEHAAIQAVKLAEKKLKKSFPKDDWEFEAREMVDHAVRCAELIFSLKPSADAKLIIEKRVSCGSISPDLHGSLDYAWVEEWGLVRVIDFKYGAGVPVAPIDEEGNLNPQLMIYLMGLLEFILEKDPDFEFEELKISIIQPRVFSASEVPHLEATVPHKELKIFEKEVREAIKIAKGPKPPLKAGTWCRWCPALATCEEASKNQLKKAEIVFDVDTGIEAAPDPKGLTVKTLPNILDACDVLEDWIKAVREHAFILAQSGTKISGRKLVEKRGSRVWLPGAEKAAKRQFGSLAFRTEFISPAQLEKAAGKEGKEGAKKFIEKHAASVSSGVSLVKEKDRRKETSSIAFDLDTKKIRN